MDAAEQQPEDHQPQDHADRAVRDERADPEEPANAAGREEHGHLHPDLLMAATTGVTPVAPAANDPLEVKLAFQVKQCRTCQFFWPPKQQPPTYGPYPTYDFEQNYPAQTAPPAKSAFSYPWVHGATNLQGFPEPEVIDGCRKAPIMTIGINPNLTAALPETTGAAWAYPRFSDTAHSNGLTKYAWYYRY